ncbi:MAG TPA: hypothetical protein VNG33_10440 [Polyangiaceae bacterium]|nr:hypothetical protein [Polyangiaceae bacterium]
MWFVILLGGCAEGVQINQALYDAQLTKEYPFARSACFAATIKALEDIHTPVERSADESGMIWSKKGITFSGVNTNAAQTNAQTFTDEHRFTLRVEGNDRRCTIRTVRYETWENNKELTEVNEGAAKSLSWDPFFSAIAKNLERAKEFEQSQ